MIIGDEVYEPFSEVNERWEAILLGGGGEESLGARFSVCILRALWRW